MTADNRRFLKLKDAAKVAGVSADTLARAIHAGDLKAKKSAKDEKGRAKTGGMLLVRVADLDAWFEGLPDA